MDFFKFWSKVLGEHKLYIFDTTVEKLFIVEPYVYDIFCSLL